MISAKELVARTHRLASLPEAYLHIQRLMRDPNSSVDDFSHAVQSDPALSARVLRVANSAFFGVSRKVETISLAINLMGISRLHDLVLATSVISTFGALKVGAIDMGAFWRRSIHTGILARMLAEDSGMFDSERLFVGGLLHDIGHLVMYLHIPEQALSALEASRTGARPLAETERAVLGFDYGDVGAELMDAWLFPASMQEMCRLHLDPLRARAFPRETALVHLAWREACAHDPEPASLPFLPPTVAEAFARANVSRDTLTRVSAASAAPLAETLELLLHQRAA